MDLNRFLKRCIYYKYNQSSNVIENIKIMCGSSQYLGEMLNIVEFLKKNSINFRVTSEFDIQLLSS